MDNNQHVRRAPNVTLRWVLRGFCIAAGAAIAWMLATAVSQASPLTDVVPEPLSSTNSSSSSASSPVATKLTQTKKQLTQTTKKATKTTGSVVNMATSKVQKSLAPVTPKPVKGSIDKAVKVVNHAVGYTTDAVTKVVEKPASTAIGVVPPPPASPPTNSTSLPPTGNLDPQAEPAPQVFTPEALLLPSLQTINSNDTLPFPGQPLTITNSRFTTPATSDHPFEPKTSLQNVAATISSSINFSAASLVGILPLALAVFLGALYMGMFRELRGGVVKRPYLVPVTPD